MEGERIGIYSLLVSLLASIIYALSVNLLGLKNVVGVALLIPLILFIVYSPEIVENLLG